MTLAQPIRCHETVTGASESGQPLESGLSPENITSGHQEGRDDLGMETA